MTNETELMAGVVEAVMQAHYTRQYQGESITADAVAISPTPEHEEVK